MLNQQPFIQEVLMKNTYKLMMKHNPHPSCKPSNDKKHHMPKNSPPRSCASLQKRRKPRTRAKNVTLTREQVVL
jgi:hypothetical protein